MQQFCCNCTEDFERTLSSLRKGQSMNNSIIRIEMLETGIKQWELAKILGISESSLSRKLRNELPVEEQNKIVSMIEQSRGEHDE